MDRDSSAYDEVYAYTMGRAGFILQHVVDAQTAQTADATTSPMGIVFALVGLYLRVERQSSGHDVQRVHQRLARDKRRWPAIALPRDRGRVTAADVLEAAPGPARDGSIDDWCRSVWLAYADSRPAIVNLLREHRIV
jgi:hypothetical protein